MVKFECTLLKTDGKQENVFQTFKGIQEHFSGHIETIPLRENGYVLCIDEEGALKRLLPNRQASERAGVLIVGDAFIVPVELLN